MLFTSTLKFFSFVYLSVLLQLKVDCFGVGLTSLGPMLAASLLGLEPTSALALVIACTAAFMASMVPCAIAYVIVWDSVIFC